MSISIGGTQVLVNDATIGDIVVEPVDHIVQIAEPIIGTLEIEDGPSLLITDFNPVVSVTELTTELEVVEETTDLTVIEGGYFPNARAELVQDPFYLFGDIEGGSGGKLGIQTRLADVLVEEPGSYANPHIEVDRKGRIRRIRQGAEAARDTEIYEFAAVNTQLVFFLPAQAHKILHVFVNQLDYQPWCELNPPGSGRVIYTPPENGYIPEDGDWIVIHWQRL